MRTHLITTVVNCRQRVRLRSLLSCSLVTLLGPKLDHNVSLIYRELTKLCIIVQTPGNLMSTHFIFAVKSIGTFCLQAFSSYAVGHYVCSSDLHNMQLAKCG